MAKMIIAVLLLFVRPALAADPWTKAQIGQQVAFTVLLAADWGQTRSETDLPPDQREFHELNPILGPYPSTQEVDQYFAVAAVGHFAVAHFLPARKIASWMPMTWRDAWQHVWIAREAISVSRNYSIGVKFDF